MTQDAERSRGLADQGEERARRHRSVRSSSWTPPVLENEARRESFIVAPQSGTVTQLQADKGKQVSPAVPMMNLIPSGSMLIAQSV
jgi:hypothetical protein